MSDSLTGTHPERRRATRLKSFLRGMVSFNNKRTVHDCLIRDISPYGARLVFAEATVTPDVLDLHIPQKEQTFHIHVIWRHGFEVGVAFAHAKSAEPANSNDLAERVQKLESELATLKRLLRRIKPSALSDSDEA